MIREIFKMLKQYAVDNPTLPGNQCFHHLIKILVECKLFSRNAELQRWTAKHLGHTWYFRNFFSIPTVSTSASYPHESNPWSSNLSEHTSPHVMSESQTPVQDQRCQSGPTARNSVNPSEGRFSKNHGADQQWLQISDLHFDNFSTPATFACWKRDSRPRYVLVHNFLRKRCNGSRKWSWLIQWMNWDLRHLLVVSQCRILKYSMRGLLQHWTKSSIIPSSKGKSVWRNKKAQKEDRFLRGRQIAYMIYEQFRVTGTHDSVENYTDLFTIALRNDDIQEFDSKWDGILLSMTKIPHDDILEGLYKLRIRESEILKTVLELYNMETHQKKLGPDLHRLKAMVKRSIEQGSSQIEDNGEKKNREESTNSEFSSQER